MMIVAIITTAMMMTTSPSSLADAVEFLLEGRGFGGACFNIPAIRPISVCIPVATTTARPWPYVAAVPLKIMLWRSPSAASSGIGATSFETGRLSPVSAASAV